MVRSSLLLTCATAAGAQTVYTQYGGSPPVYPSPNITGAGGWETAMEKARAFVNELTLEEKAQMVTGTSGPCVGNIGPVPRLNFSGLCLQGGPLGIRQAIDASVFPAAISVAAAWDRDLARQRGVFMAEEFRGKGAHIALSPVVGALGRSPFGGRNWESFSPDAYLSGELVEDTLEGMQSVGVQACVKHFIANEQEIQRNPTVNANGTTIEALSSNIDDKTMHETYLWPFANAIRAGSASVMCSYQRINGSYGCQNSKALNGLLKGELGFQGYVMSDWAATHSGVSAIQAGLDMNMPGRIGFTGDASYFGGNITIAVNNGSLPVSRVDDMVLRIMTPYYFLDEDSGFPQVDGYSPYLNFAPPSDYIYNFTIGPEIDVRKDEHIQLIRELGAAGTVLLKNTDSALPLKTPKRVGVFGNDAADFTFGQYLQVDVEFGTLAVGGGSGTGRFFDVVSPLEAIRNRVRSYRGQLQYITDNKAIAESGADIWTPKGTATLAPLPLDVCIVFLKSFASENAERFSLLPEWNSTVVVEKVTEVCINTVVVTHGAAPNVYPWRNNPNVTAILAAHMPGEQTGNAIADLLWGDINPSGKLPYTIANNASDYAYNIVNSTELLNTNDPNAWQADFTEGNLIDYKEFDTENKSVAYEFGFGLSYTTFNVSDLVINVDAGTNVSRTPSPNAPILPGGNIELWATLATVDVTVSNTGDRDGAAVPQLYLSYPDEAEAPVRSLRGFEKVMVAAGGSSTIRFDLTRRDLSYWDTTAQTWRLPSGEITVQVGFSSRDLPLQGFLSV